jgi:filamentous hemagglutinin family protein
MCTKKYKFVPAAALIATLFATATAHADPGQYETPTGFSLQSGAVTAPVLSGANSENMMLNQTSARAVVNWTTYNIGQSASVNYVFGDAGQVLINRVTGPQIDPSQIFGTLNATVGSAMGPRGGTVILMDRNGVIFGPNSKVNVGSLLATTGNLVNQADFMTTGRIALRNVNDIPTSKIDNKGVITLADGGMLAFVAPYVANSGTITAKLGKVTLASGSKATVDFAGDDLITLDASSVQGLVENSGKIAANGGVITMTAKMAAGVVDTVVNNTGTLQADAFGVHAGKIVLSTGGTSKISVAGTLSTKANASAPAGTVTVRTADTVNIGNTKLSGGKIEVRANTVNLSGKIKEADNTVITDPARMSSNAQNVYVLSSAASIQQGINLAPANKSVWLSGGTYKENFVIDKSLTVSATGTGPAPILRGAVSGGNIVTVTGDKVRLWGYTIDGGTTSASGTPVSDYGIYADSVSELNIGQIRVRNVTLDGIRVVNSGLNGSLESPLEGIYFGPINISAAVDNAGRDGVVVVNSANTVVRSNVAGAHRNGIDVADSQDVVVSSAATQVDGDALYIHGGKNIIVVSAETGFFSNDTGLHVGGNGLFAEDVNGLKVTNSYFTHVAMNGIDLENVTNAQIYGTVNHPTGVYVDFTGGNGILINGGNNISISNTAIGGKSSGSNQIISSNPLAKIGANGISVTGGATNVFLSSNPINLTGLDGIHVEGSPAINISHNAIGGGFPASITGYGINVDGSPDALISGNAILNTLQGNILITNSPGALVN